MKFRLALALAAFTSIGLSAQDPIDQIIAAVVANNPELKAQSQLVAAQRAEDSDANSLNNPEFSMSRVWGRHGIGNKLQIDVTQSFDWPGVYSARRKAAAYGQNAAQLLVDWSTVELRQQVRELLTELIYVRKQLELLNVLQHDMEQMRQATEKAQAQGQLTVLDRKKLTFERYELDNQYSSTLVRQNQIIAEIQALANGTQIDFDHVTEYPMISVLNADEYKQHILQSDPQLVSQSLIAEQESYNASAASRSRLPGFSVGYQHQAEMGDRFNGFSFGMSLPFFQNRHAKSAALARKGAAESSQALLLAQKYADVDVTLRDIDIWRNQIDRYMRVFGDNEYLTLLSKAYAGGEISVIEYLGEVHYYHQATFQYLEAEYNYHQAAARLNKYL